MPILQPQTCSSCGRGYEVAILGDDCDDVSKVNWDQASAVLADLLTDAFKPPHGWPGFSKPECTQGALFSLWISDLAAVAQRTPESSGWLIRYAISPDAARLGGRFEVRFGKPGDGGVCVVVRVPPGIRHGTTLRVGGVCPDGSDLLLKLDIRLTPAVSMLGRTMTLCPACEARCDQSAQAEQARREQRTAQLPHIGMVIGFGLFLLLCLVIWAVFG